MQYLGSHDACLKTVACLSVVRQEFQYFGSHDACAKFLLGACTGVARMQRRMRLEGQLSRLERVPDDPKPVEHHISHLVDAHTCAVNPRHRHRMVRTVCCSLSYAFMHDRPSLLIM